LSPNKAKYQSLGSLDGKQTIGSRNQHGEMDRSEARDFDKRQIVMARRLGQSTSEAARLVGCAQSAGTNHKPATGCSSMFIVPKAHRCTRAMKAIPSGLSQQKVDLLWHKSHKILMMVMGGMCHNTAECL